MAKFDLARTAELAELFAVPPEKRDDAWVERFYAAVPDASLATGEQQVVRGPDGLPYFRLEMPRPHTAFDAFCLTHVLDVCLVNGFGCVILGEDDRPEWVFGYGSLWSYRAFGTFDASEPGAPAAGAPTGDVLLGSPSEELLPDYARAVLRRELEAAGVTEPGVLLVTQADGQRSFAFPVYAEDFADDTAFQGFMRRLTWFVPPHLGLVSVPRAAGWRFGPL